MTSDEDRIDLSPLDRGDWNKKAAALAARARQMHRFRRAVVVRGMTALALSAAAALALWFSAPSPEPQRSQPTASSSSSSLDLLNWAVRDADPTEVLRYAQ